MPPQPAPKSTPTTAPTDAPGAAPGETPTSWLGVALGLSLGALAAYHFFKLPPVLPFLLQQYDYGLFAAGAFMSIYAAVGLATSVLLGSRLQRYGMPPFLLAAALFLILGSIITLSAPENIALMLVARGVEGLGFAVLAIAGPVLASASASHRHKTIAIAIIAAWIPLGQLIALAVAHPFAGSGDWRPIWWVGIGLTVIIIALAWRTGARHVPRRRGVTDGGPAPLRDFSRHKRLTLVLVAAIFTLWSTEMFAMLTWLPQYLVEDRGLGAQAAILVYGLPALLVLIFNLAGGYLLRAGVPLAPLLAFSLVLQAVVWFLLPHLDGALYGLAGLVVFGIGAGMTPTCLFAAPGVILGPANAGGSAFGIIMTGRSTGVLLGPILLPPILLALGAWGAVGPIFGGISLAAALAALGLGVMLARGGRATLS
jgi:predicted MFS family arabinose efflux permease